MQVSVTFRNTEAADWFKNYVNDSFQKLRKYLDKPLEAHVIISVEKFRNVAEVNLMAKGININGKEEAKDMQLAFDSVMEKIERQIKKHKEKTRNHKEISSRAEAMSSLETAEEFADERPRIAETRKVALIPMSPEEAILQLEETKKNRFVIFRDSSTERVSLIFTREDGNYILVETSG
ncbi:MAG: ribosome-associated translation inhibitor RaiA [Syntrophales bacterium]|nr:ribosome-associated translation inhibitor RaiA [Syntrophales bacterium]MDD5532810.1 ribosome-associated translation inhibitor RaiA [Syntrophales bacterium]